MSGRLKRKWRPPLALVIGGTLAVVLFVPFIGIAYFRLAGNILGWGETSWLLGWLAVVATTVLGFLLWRLVLRPVWALTAYARSLRYGKSEAPAHFGTPEFRDLAQAVTEMGATLQGRATQLRAYADHVTHELKSPLTALRGASELLAADPEPSTRETLLRTITDATARMELLLGDLQRHARASQSSGPGHVLLSVAAQGLAVSITRDGRVALSEVDLRAVLTQLVQNARAHGATEVQLHVDDGALVVRDNGLGVPSGDAGRIFDPFFTTRRDSGGTGMGLSIVRSLLQANGAEIVLLESQNGASFRISFSD